MNRDQKLLAALLLLTVALRSIALNSRGIWYDDAFSIFLSRQPLPVIISGTAADTMPPLYYFLLHTWMQISQSLWFLRLVNVAIGTATVFVLYALVSRLLDRTAGLWAAFLAAISPLQIYQAQELRSYALLALCQAGYAWFFIRIWQSEKSGSRWDWLGLVLCGAGAMYCHNLAVFVLAAPDLFLLLRRNWGKLARLVAAQLVIGLLALPWLLYLPTQMAKIQGGWSIPRPGLVEILQAIIIFVSNLPLPPGIWLAVALLLSLWGIVLTSFELAHEREKSAQLELLAAFALVPPLLMLVVSYLFRPVFVTRGFIFSALAFNGLAGFAVARHGRGAGALLLGVFVAGALVALPYQYTFHEFPRSPFQQASGYLAASIQPGDRVINDDKLSYFPLHFYAPSLEQNFLADIPGSHNDTLAPGSQQALGLFPEKSLTDAVGDGQRVFFVVFKQAEQDYAELGQPVHPALAWLRAHFKQTGQVAFSDLEIYQFTR